MTAKFPTTYFPCIVSALNAVKNVSDPMLHAIEQLSGAHSAFVTNGSGSKVQVEASIRYLDRIIEWATKARDQTKAALDQCPPAIKGKMRVIEGGRPTPIVRRPSDDQPPPMRA